MAKAYPKRLSSEQMVLDSDRGRSTPALKRAVPTSLPDAVEREFEREGLRDLDRRLEAARGLTRAQRDAQRIAPRATPADITHPVKERKLPGAQSLRKPLSGRQQKDRRKAARTVIDAMPATQYQAVREILNDKSAEGWHRINDALSDAAGDIDSLPERDRLTARRLDRAIQACERKTGRGHVVYANVGMPASINRSNLSQYVVRQYQAGDEVAFDRYTGTAHSLHEVTPTNDPAGRVAVFEIQTRRGLYLGKSEGSDNTEHLLPRGMQFRVVATHQATYISRSGQRGSRTVIQLQDITPEPHQGA